jgi:hypothetical protein
MRKVIAVSVGIVAVFAACVTLAGPREYFTITSSPPRAALPHRVLLLPLDVTVYRVGAGGVTERAEDLTEEERTETEALLKDDIARDKHLEFVKLPPLDSASQALLDEHIALYEQVAGAALMHTGSFGAWPRKVSHFDYTLGDGLSFLKQRTGADAALFILGQGGVPTASSYVAGLLPLLVGVVSVPQANAQAVVSVVDLETGNLLWLEQGMARGSVPTAVSTVLREYPDITTPDTTK